MIEGSSGIGRVQARIEQIQARFGLGREFAAAYDSVASQAVAAVDQASDPAERAVAEAEAAFPEAFRTPVPAPSPARAAARLGPYATEIGEAARENGLDPSLVRAVVQAESGFDPRATSPVGAMGLMQLMPGTARDLGVDAPYDPRQNLRGGSRYLRGLTDRFGLEKGIAAYNAGPGAVERHGGVPPYQETQAYVRKVMALYDQFRR